MKSLLFLFPFVLCSQAFFFNDQEWAALKTTWNPNPFSKYGFDAMPRDLNDDDLDGFILKDDQCNGTKFVGKRYFKDGDNALILLFDINGYIAGMQNSIPKSELTPPETQFAWFTDDGDYWTLTAYFVPPSIVCTTGRSKSDYDNEGTGRGLFLQIGPNPLNDYMEIPLEQRDIGRTNWTLGHCFYTMGVHYWYQVSTNMDCDNFVPFFLLYNKKKLNGWGFANYGKHESPRYEHPSPSVVNKFIAPYPNCFKTDPRLQHFSTMHVYFTNYPQLQFC